MSLFYKYCVFSGCRSRRRADSSSRGGPTECLVSACDLGIAALRRPRHEYDCCATVGGGAIDCTLFICKDGQSGFP